MRKNTTSKRRTSGKSGVTLLLALALMMTGFCVAETSATESTAQADDPQT